MSYPEDSLFPYYNPSLSRVLEGATSELGSVLSRSNHEVLSILIESEQATLAVLRPALGPEANLYGAEDTVAAEQMEGRIQNLVIAPKFSMQLDPEAVDRFYGVRSRILCLRCLPTCMSALIAKVYKHFYVTKTLLKHYKIERDLVEYARYIISSGTEGDRIRFASGIKTKLQIRYGEIEFYK